MILPRLWSSTSAAWPFAPYLYSYAIDYIQKECHKLANLERHDRAGFEERSMFFSLGAIVSILSDYVQEVHRTIDASVSKAGHGNTEVY